MRMIRVFKEAKLPTCVVAVRRCRSREIEAFKVTIHPG